MNVMLANSREEASKAKQGSDTGCLKFLKASNSRQWSGHRNPRIVRVSRTFGGKDRHSKVCTIRGLRDRRIRLSVPTAIQLYDLQDRLGLGQPSKVIDWLLEVTKLDIDKLPPLQIPQGFDQFYPHPMVLAHESSASQHSLPPSFFDVTSAFNAKDEGDHGLIAKSKYWDVGFLKGKEEDRRGSIADKGKWTKTTEELENQDGVSGYCSQMSAQNFFSSTSQSLLPLPSKAITYSSYHPVEPSSLSLSQFGIHGTMSSPSEPNNGSVVSFPTALPVSFAGSQLFVCPSSASATVSPAFASYPPYMSTSVNSDPRLFNHVQLFSSSSQVLPHSLIPSIYMNSPLKSFPSQLDTKLPGSEIQNQSQLNKDKCGSKF